MLCGSVGSYSIAVQMQNLRSFAISISWFMHPSHPFQKASSSVSSLKVEDTEFRKDTNSYLNNLAQLAGLCYKSSDYAAAIRHATEGLQMARTHGLQNLEAKFLMYIGMSQFYTGITKDAQANMNRSIALYEKIVDKEQSWSSVNDLLYTLGETMTALCAIGDYEQAATLIPNILKANSRHEQMVDQAPPGAIVSILLASSTTKP